MKKNYERVELNICIMNSQDIVTSSVFVEWDNNWQQDDILNDYIFG